MFYEGLDCLHVFSVKLNIDDLDKLHYTQVNEEKRTHFKLSAGIHVI